MKKFPIRSSYHILEEKSLAFFKSKLPADWNINTIDRDYGQDLNIEICEDGVLKGLEFILQMKSSHNSSKIKEFEKQVFNVSTYNYLKGNLRFVMIAKYIEDENEAYWILLKDVPEPNQENDTFTIYLPRKNKLSTIDWGFLVNLIREVSVTMKEVSYALAEVFDTGRFIKGAFDLAAIYDNRWQKFIRKINKNIAPENFTKGHPSIVIPAMEGLNLQYEDSLLSELFTNLLSASMDKTKQDLAHPAFPNILNQLSYDEAVILFCIKKKDLFSKVDEKQENKYKKRIELEYYLFDDISRKLNYPKHIKLYLNHLKALELVTFNSPFPTQLLLKGTDVLDLKSLPITKTAFGKLFADACIPDEFEGL